MRLRRSQFLAIPLVVTAIASVAAFAHGCGSDDDTPTPSTKVYPRDPIDGLEAAQQIKLVGLGEAVRVVRDKRGMVHVYARNAHDAAMAQGYMIARDRAPQLELIRRVATGRLAEYAGNLQHDLADRDIMFRALGLRRVAAAYYATLKDGSETKETLKGYAAGVTAYFQQIRNGTASGIPNGWLAIRKEKYTDWDPVDSLAIARLQTWSLSYTGDDETDFTELYTKFHDTFDAATDPALKARALMSLDVMRFEPAVKRPVLDGSLGGATAYDLPRGKKRVGTVPRFDDAFLAPYRPMVAAAKAARNMLGKGGWSSNNWTVSPSKSAEGKAMVASDPHLGLAAPAIFHMVSLHVSADPAVAGSTPRDVAGMSFAGIPGVVLGFNKYIAWGATVAEFDVNDLYQDTVKDGHVTIGGKQVDIVKIDEMLDYGDGKPQPITIETIPGHGVIFPTVENNRFVARKTDKVLSVRWTGMEPSGEVEAFVALNQAKNVDEAVTAMKSFQVGAQNFVFGDSQGNIAYTTHARVPVRPAGAFAWDATKFKGTLPCLALAGDAGLEWTGNLADDKLPGARNPAVGYVATANSDQFGLSFDNDPSNGPLYLNCAWDAGYRTARVRERLDEKDKHTAEDLASIQADVKSPLGARIAKHFAAAIDRAEKSRLGTKPAPDLDAVVKDPRYVAARMQFVKQSLELWGSESGYEAASGWAGGTDPAPTEREVRASQATLVFNAAMIPLYGRVFDDEWKAMGKPPWPKDYQTKGLLRMLEKPEPLATADASGESVLWDDLGTKDVLETKDQQLVLAMLDGLDFIVKKLGDDPDKWRWGSLHTIRFKSLLTGTSGSLSIPGDPDPAWPEGGFPRHGDEDNIDRGDFGLGGTDHKFEFGYSSGPAQRMVAVLDPAGPQVKNALPGGNIWIPGSAHFADEAELWRLNKTKKVVFSPGDVVVEAESRIDLLPP